MTKELIHIDDHRGQLRCDTCGHELGEGVVTWGEHLIGYPYPACESSMLTRADYEGSERVNRAVRWINKYFGWLGDEYDPKDPNFHSVIVHHHDGKTIITPEK